MTVVADASAVVAVLADGGPEGRSVAEALSGHALAAPELLPFEVANVLRRLEARTLISPETSALAHADLQELSVQLWPYRPLATRVWGLRGSLTAYDASYVALAAHLDATLITLDQKLARAAAETCRVVVPGG